MNTLEMIKNYIIKMKSKYDEKEIKKLDLPLMERVAIRLEEFSDTCETCSKMLNELEADLKNILQEKQSLDKDTIFNYKKNQKMYSSHLTKEHELVRDGYYTEAYIALGLSIGLVFGIAVFDNIAIWLPIGLALGVAIGSSKDADAKKQGNVI